jgi:myo-inositol 2-dehydrogenase/D-chiro-inositol 1-dehydrogenase
MNQTLTRRSFLNVSVAAPAVLSGQSPGDTLRVAVVGVGNRGSFLLRHMLRVPGTRVVAVCDIDTERARKAAAMVSAAAGEARVWEDFRKMLDEQKEIDAVILATPDWTHKDFDIAILEVGKHLYAEKPLALTAEDCRAVATAARQAKGIMQVGFQLRHDPKRNAALKFIHGGGIGKVLMCHGMRHSGEGMPRNIPWYRDRTKSGDIIVDQGIHILDLFTWAIGAHPLRAMATGGQNLFIDEPPGRTVMDGYSLLYEYPNGVYVNFSHHYYDPPRFTGDQERVFGSNGAIDLVQALWQPRESKESVTLEVPDDGQDSTYMALASFADSVKNGKQPINNVESALVSTLAPIMATRAIYEKRIVTWEEVAG